MKRWWLETFLKNEDIILVDSIYAFNPFKEEGHIERSCYFTLTDLKRDALYDLGVPAIDEEKRYAVFLFLYYRKNKPWSSIKKITGLVKVRHYSHIYRP